jgi:replicative DNA helicase
MVYEVGEITGALKKLAKDEDLCVIALSQLKRAGSQERKGARPTLDDLRESGDIEADADVVVFIHRDSYYIKQTDDYIKGDQKALNEFADKQFDAELIIGKARAGSTPTIHAKCNMASSSLFEGNYAGCDDKGTPIFGGAADYLEFTY